MKKLEMSLWSIRVLFNEVCSHESLHDKGREDQQSINNFLKKMEIIDLIFLWIAVVLSIFVLVTIPFLLAFTLCFSFFFIVDYIRVFLSKKTIQYICTKYHTSSVRIWMGVYAHIYQRFSLIENEFIIQGSRLL